MNGAPLSDLYAAQVPKHQKLSLPSSVVKGQRILKMGAYSNRNHLMPEVSAGSSLPHFTWFYPGHFLPGSRPGPHSLQGNQINLESDLAVEAIRSAAPPSDPVKIPTSETKPQKARKQRPSSKNTDQNAPKALKPKQTKKSPKKTKEKTFPEAKREKRNLNLDEQRTNFDLSGVPSPYCSCTGIARVCYKWGAGGWQSSCCTIKISEHPLPMSPSRPGSRIAGRKMSNGAYEKLLLKLASEGYDLSHSVDLKDHWARHGTNKFVTIK